MQIDLKSLQYMTMHLLNKCKSLLAGFQSCVKDEYPRKNLKHFRILNLLTSTGILKGLKGRYLTKSVTNKSKLSFSLHCLFQVLLVWPMLSTSSASSNWPPKTSLLLLTVASEVPSPSPLASCWRKSTFPWERCSLLLSSPLSSSLSLFR